MCVFKHRFKKECARDGCECGRVTLTLGGFIWKMKRKKWMVEKKIIPYCFF